MVLGSSPVAVTSPSDFAPASSKEFLDIQATIECGFTLKRVRDMRITYSISFCSQTFLTGSKCTHYRNMKSIGPETVAFTANGGELKIIASR